MENKLIAVIMALVVGVILAGSLLMPVISDATATEKTFTNEGYFRMTHYGTDAEITLEWSAENPRAVIVNDVEIPINYNVVGGQVTIVADTNFIVRLNTFANDTDSLSYIGASGGTHSTSEAATIEFSGGSATITNTVSGSSVSYSATYTDLYIPSLDGPFIMKDAAKSAYLNEDSEVFAYGMTRVKTYSGASTSAPGFGLEFAGSIEDGITSNIWRGSGLTLSDEQINYQTVDNYLDLYSFQSITAVGTYTETVDEETVTTDTLITYSYLLVPYQVTAEKSLHFDSGEIAIIAVIPVLIIAALVIFAVRMVYYRE